MHKGRGKTLQSDSCGAKEWGIDRGTDKDRERIGVKSRAGEKERERSNEKQQMRGSKERQDGDFLCSTWKGCTPYIEQCPRSCLRMFFVNIKNLVARKQLGIFLTLWLDMSPFAGSVTLKNCPVCHDNPGQNSVNFATCECMFAMVPDGSAVEFHCRPGDTHGILGKD